MISQITPAGISPASRARSTAASVWPTRSSTPPVLGLQREHVAGLDELARAGLGVDGHLDRVRAVGGRDAGADALARLDRDRERGLECRSRSWPPSGRARARRSARGSAPGRSAPALLAHEVDRLGGDELRGHRRGRPRSRGPRRRRRRPSCPGGCPRWPPRSSRMRLDVLMRPPHQPLYVLGHTSTSRFTVFRACTRPRLVRSSVSGISETVNDRGPARRRSAKRRRPPPSPSRRCSAGRPPVASISTPAREAVLDDRRDRSEAVDVALDHVAAETIGGA